MIKNNTNKIKLIELIKKTEKEADILTSQGRSLIQHGQHISDLANYTNKFIQLVPDDSFYTPQQWDSYCSEWGNAYNRIDATNQLLGDTKSLVFTVNSTATASGTAVSSVIIPILPENVQEEAWSVYESFEQVIEQTDFLVEIEKEIKRLKLSSPKNKESIFSLIQQGKNSFSAPSVKDISPAAVLIPIREAINRTFADLLPKRPIQEKSSGNREKVSSICTQCCQFDIKAEQIEHLANEAYNLNDLLSGAKQTKLNRDEVREYMNRALLFLLTFLQAIDENKLR